MLTRFNISLRTASGALLDYVFLYQHKMRTEWGYGAVIDTQEDRTTFRFNDGSLRTIKQGHIHLMVRVELEEPEATEVRKSIARRGGISSPTATAKRPAKPKKKAEKKVAAVVAEPTE